MKKLLTLFILLPFFSFAQKAEVKCDLDIHGCYMYAMRALAHGEAGLETIAGKKRTKSLYFSKTFYTVGFPETIDGYTVRFIDIDLNKQTLLEEQQSKKGLVTYMSELSLGADTCSLWLIPIKLEKNGEEITTNYSDDACHVYFYFNQAAGKMCYAKTECQKGKKD